MFRGFNMKIYDKFIYSFLGFAIFSLIFVFITLFHLNFKLMNENLKNKPDIIKHKDKIIVCLKEQLECYNQTRTMEKSKIIKICKDIDFCEKN